MAFAKTKEYFNGRLTDTRAERIRVIRVNGKPVYERCGGTKRLFGKWSWEKGDISEKFLMTFVFIISFITFGLIAIVAVGIALFRTIYFFVVERFNERSE